STESQNGSSPRSVGGDSSILSDSSEDEAPEFTKCDTTKLVNAISDTTHPQIFDFYLSSGANPNAICLLGRSAIIQSFILGNAEAFKALLRHGADIFQTDGQKFDLIDRLTQEQNKARRDAILNRETIPLWQSVSVKHLQKASKHEAKCVLRLLRLGLGTTFTVPEQLDFTSFIKLGPKKQLDRLAAELQE